MIKLQFKIKAFFRKIWEDIRHTFSRENIRWVLFSGSIMLLVTGICCAISKIIVG